MVLQQIKALLGSVGSSFCPDYSDWFGTDAADFHARNADKSVLSKFLQAHPADYSTKKLQVRLEYCIFSLAHGKILMLPNFFILNFLHVQFFISYIQAFIILREITCLIL